MYGYDQTGAPPGPGPGHGAHGYQHAGHASHPGQQGHQAPPPPYGAQQGAPPYGQPGPQQQPLYPEPSPPSLQEAIRAFTTGSMSAEDFQGIFSTSKVYCPRGDTPGFLALHNTQQPVIPMFSTLKELRAYAGKESKYFVITGAEVLDLLPSGYGFVLDMEGEHRVVFDAKAVEEMVDFAMRRMYG
ncbi:SseB family protein [Streptomyces sp. 891-h]|uniref:SseB family protein n=1 Tax=unclassified Streptomyces TaxID=2593676 RepID=UPI001FA9B891|nr:SseB family protein [Streptomyces sp. 891-h]UNZ18333.1 SseB family protein [Streptomyces sp. 891-h]